jgi:hypothetical protein
MKVKSVKQCLEEGFSLFVDKEIPKNIFLDYYEDKDGEGTYNIQEWIINNLKDHIAEWCTGIGVIEAVEHIVITAYENGSIQLSEAEKTRFKTTRPF